MTERYTVIDKRTFSYEGYFRADDFFKVLRRFLKERGYNPHETKNFEEVYEHGRQITFEMKPWRTLSDYVKKELVINIVMMRITDKIVEIDGVKQKYQHGKVTMTFDAVVVSDFKSKYEGAGWLYFLRILNDKFIRKDWMSGIRDDVTKDANDMLEELRSYLNMIRFKID